MVLMSGKSAFIVIIILIFPFILNAQENDESISEKTQKVREDFFIAPVFEVSMFGRENASFGGGIMLGYGTGSALGLKFTWLFSEEGFSAMELLFFLRLYFMGINAYSGPFIQFLGGTALINRLDSFSFPSISGSFSAGLSLGWRIMINNRWYVEPALSGGYPYIFSGGISAGVRF